MEKAEQKIQIVEYHDGLAPEVADMWNASRDSWGGDTALRSAEDVIAQESNLGNLKVFLAMEGKEVVGYCSFSEYREDEGASYIPLLNVRPTHHGKKIGKMLVLEAIKESVKQKWPRLDLYTWPGNTKAVPLYKRCGFFWEDRDETTHLMNFLPTVLNTEALSEFFIQADWYEDSRRVIEVQPDGRNENQFTYYAYEWETKSGRKLKVEFERSGRGIRMIETDDYLIKAEVEGFSLVAGGSYNIRYEIVNKSGIPLTVGIQGEDHKEVAFSFSETVDVSESATVTAPFYLSEAKEEQSKWRTHPSVVTRLSINGREAVFKVGIEPKFPANVAAVAPETRYYPGRKSVFYIELENNYGEEAAFSAVLPGDGMLDLYDPKVAVTLKPKQKASIPISFSLIKNGFYSPEIKFTVQRNGKEDAVFAKKIGVAFKGLGVKFYGESDKYWWAANGLYHFTLSKLDNEIMPLRDQVTSTLLFPKLGKPYGSEFSKRRPDRIEFLSEEGSAGIKAYYKSGEFPGLEMAVTARLFAEGLLEHRFEVSNQLEQPSGSDVWVNLPIYHELDQLVIPYEDKIIEHKSTAMPDYGQWDPEKFTENWLFSDKKGMPEGFSWPSGANMNFQSWHFYVEQNLGIIQGGQTVQSEPVYMSLGAFQTWEDFRSFALQAGAAERVLTESPILLSINKGNPVISGETAEVVIEHKMKSLLHGEAKLNFNGTTMLSKSFHRENAANIVSDSMNLTNPGSLALIGLEGIHDGVGFESSKLVFVQSPGEVAFSRGIQGGKEVLTASNGPVEISAAPEFYPALYSLKVNGTEWLDHSFPELGPKSWWNPWSGGFRSAFSEDLSSASIAKETSRGRFVSFKDQFANVWKGIELKTEITKHEKYKGITMKQYFLLVPGVPAVCHFSRIEQECGSFIAKQGWLSSLSINQNSNPGETWIENNGERVFTGEGEYGLKLDGCHAVGRQGAAEVLQIVPGRESDFIKGYVNKEVFQLYVHEPFQLANGAAKNTAPVFLAFGSAGFPEKSLKELKEIRFVEEV